MMLEMNHVITVNFKESTAHNVNRPWGLYVYNICKKDYSTTEF